MNAPAIQLPDRPPSSTDVDALIEAFEQRYNTGDADAVAALYHPEARWLAAAGAVFEGRSQIRDALRSFMLAVPPRLALTELDRFAFGDHAVSRGIYTLSADGGSADRGSRPTMSGAYLNLLGREAGVWRIVSQQMNYAFPISPEMWVGTAEVMPALPVGETASGVTAICEQLLGSAPPFGDLLTADVCAALPGRPWEIGCEAVGDQLLRNNGRRSRVRFHELEGWRLSLHQSAHVGWYEVIRDDALDGGPSRWGTATLVVRQQLDGTRRIRWLVATASPEA